MNPQFEDLISKSGTQKTTFLATDPKTKKVFKIEVTPATEQEQRSITEKWLAPMSSASGNCTKCGKPL